MHRRHFLTASLGASVPWIWPRAANARDGSGGGPNDRIAITLIGAGPQGVALGRQAAKLGEMVACADVYHSRAKEFAAQSGGKCRAYADYREVLARTDIDAIICATPDHWHTKIAIEALKAGKHVYCEKPLTLTMDESRQICQAAKAANKTFQVGTQQRTEFGGCFLKAVAIARSGRLGSRLHATIAIQPVIDRVRDRNLGPFASEDPPTGLDWDFWLGQAPQVAFTRRRIDWDYRWWLEYSGGQATTWGSHDVDVALWALGGEKTGIVEAEGKGDFPFFPEHDPVAFLNGEIRLPPVFNVARTFDCALSLPNGNTIRLATLGGVETIISGDKGRIRVNRGGLTGRPVEVIAASAADSRWLDEEVTKLYRGMPRTTHMANFFHCTKTGELPISDVDTHSRAIDACHMANIAMLVQRKVRFDLARGSFVDDETANSLMRRRQRAPYTITV